MVILLIAVYQKKKVSVSSYNRNEGGLILEGCIKSKLSSKYRLHIALPAVLYMFLSFQKEKGSLFSRFIFQIYRRNLVSLLNTSAFAFHMMKMTNTQKPKIVW